MNTNAKKSREVNTQVFNYLSPPKVGVLLEASFKVRVPVLHGGQRNVRRVGVWHHVRLRGAVA
jgi:hypothetical protein